MPYLTTTASGVRLRIYVQPGASRNQIVGVHGEALKIKIKAPPEGGRANLELVSFLAKSLTLPKRALRLSSGLTSRSKVIEIEGATGEFVAQRLANCISQKN